MRIQFAETVTITRSTGTDQFGDSTSQVEIVEEGWAVFPATPATSPQSRGRETQTFQQDLIAEERLALAPPTSQIQSNDKVQLSDGIYQVLGKPILLRSPISNRRPGIEVMLKETTG